MKKLLHNTGFDELDRAILEELQANGRISNADLARKIHLSQPAVHNRIKRLEKQGIIEQYVALLNREVVGYDLLCFVYLSLEGHSATNWEAFQTAIDGYPEVLECHQMTGDYDVLMKVVARNRSHLDQFLHKRLTTLPFVTRIKADVAIKQLKSSTNLALK